MNYDHLIHYTGAGRGRICQKIIGFPTLHAVQQLNWEGLPVLGKSRDLYVKLIDNFRYGMC